MSAYIDSLREKPLYIYGAGGVGRDILALLTSCGISEEICFIVSESAGRLEQNVYGHTLYEYNKIQKKIRNELVIVSMMPRNTKTIKDKLIRGGCEYVYTTDDFRENLYQEFYRETIAPYKLVLSNFHGRGFGDNPKYIALNLLERNPELDIVWAIGRGDIATTDKLPTGIRTVAYGSLEYYRELATARVWIDNEHKNLLSRKREDQFYIQTWHGVGPLKKIEHDAVKLPGSYLEMADRDMGMVDLCVSASRFNTEQFRRAFRYKGEILECGYPRNDIFFDNSFDRESVLRGLGIPVDACVLLYAPTFRDMDTSDEEKLDLSMAARAMARRWKKEAIVLVRNHPDRADELLPGCLDVKHIDVSTYGDVQELLKISDVLITDYSSIMWDFSLQRKPVFLFHPDNEKYEVERGFYLSFAELPYFEVASNQEMSDLISTFDEKAYIERVNIFLAKYGSYDEGRAAEMVADRILEVMECRT